uniref:Poly [ADP-ribose] polymerase n=2 Tax=Crassostrea virginica TaxID=6565 RepID=A0A8B8DC01_CRAVI|nr:poly [ADP-ribose] polymerase 14-like isoform X1 [Crassostrea virginica]
MATSYYGSPQHTSVENTGLQQRAISVPNLLSPGSPANQSSRKWVKVGDVSVAVVKGQLIDEQVDVFVNGVPPDFDLSRDPSKKLRFSAGPGLKTEIDNNFPNGLKIGQIADTGGYNLNCQRVYHVTLPKGLKDGSQNQTVSQTVKDCLERANKNGFSSVALPDLGSTIGYPAQILAKLMFTAVEDFAKQHPNPALNQVIFCLSKKTISDAFVKKAKEAAKTGVSQTSYCKIGRISVSLEVGKLSDQKVDVIVCSGPESLKLRNGGMAQSLLEVAGPALQAECDQKYPNGVPQGDLAVTAGHNLSCQFVYHGALPKWGTACTPTPKQILKTLVTKCLEEANKHPLTKTLAFPTLGTGSLGYPAKEAAEVMAECLKDFDQKYPKTELTRVTIVIYNQDKKWEAIEQIFILGLNMTKSIPMRNSPGVVPSTATQTRRGKIGRINLALKVDELAKQQVDVIVCSGPESLKLKNGGMAQSLLEVAGPALQAECDQKYPNGVPQGDLAVTAGHDLPCKYVYHGALPKWGTACTPTPKQMLKDFVTKCLEEANKHPLTKTLAFPTLGTGSLGYPAKEAAEVMAECLKDFDQRYPNTELTRITIVIYNKDKKWQTVEQEFLSALNLSRTAPTQHRSRPSTAHPLPRVNTPQYFKALHDLTAVTPSYWTEYTSDRYLKDWNLSVSSKDYKLVKLQQNSSAYSAVEKLALKTWLSNNVGQGQDASGLAQLNYKNVSITKIERLENPHLFEGYWNYREKILVRASQKSQFKSLGQISQAKNGEVRTSQIADKCLQVEIYPGINEHYLFHGTQVSYLKNIFTQGLDGRLANSPFFGAGIYCAESSTKSDQYADPKNQRDLQEKKMLLVRTCLGEMYVRTDTLKQYAYKRPPCMECYHDKCTDSNHSSSFDSIVVDGGWIFREFIVYDNHACYPEYLISYKRV